MTLARTLLDDGRLADLDAYLSDVRPSEEKWATALPGGCVIANSRIAHPGAAHAA